MRELTLLPSVTQQIRDICGDGVPTAKAVDAEVTEAAGSSFGSTHALIYSSF